MFKKNTPHELYGIIVSQAKLLQVIERVRSLDDIEVIRGVLDSMGY